MKTCPQCLEEFEGRSNKIYCSNPCKIAAFQQRNKEGPDDDLPKKALDRKSNNIKEKNSRKLSSKEIELKKHALDLEHQRKLIKLEQNQKVLSLREKELELAKKREAEQLALVNARKEKALKEKLIEEANRKAFAPIKIATQEALTQIIENGQDAIWHIEEVEELLEDIEETIDKLKGYYRDKHSRYIDSDIYNTLNELHQELEEMLSDEDCYESDGEIIINFKKGYIRELQTVLQGLHNG